MSTDPAAAFALTSGPPKRVHLIGVAGSGMSGLAALLLALGHRVSGSDKVDSAEVRRLQGLGLDFHTPHSAEPIRDSRVVIYSSAIKAGNPAFDEAKRLGKFLVRRAEALATLMQGRRGIIVAGMHGKTTTSAMAAHVLRVGGLRPSHYVGAEIPILGTNAHWDAEGEYFVAEGDESDGSVALFEPEHTILLNVEEEHLDYYADLAAIEIVFQRLLNSTHGSVIYCLDDPHAARICEGRPHMIPFGSSEGADYRFDDVRMEDGQSHFTVFGRGEKLGTATLNVPGRHNVSNATSVIALALELGVPFAKVCEALETFRGARRRFEFKHRSAHYSVVDDYGHHPSEIAATLATARSIHQGRVIVVFQPHRYTRTQALSAEFGRAFKLADHVVVADIYPASEQPIPGVTGQVIVDAMRHEGNDGGHFQPNFRRLAATVGALVAPGDLVLSLGAGNIHEVGTRLASDLVLLERLREALGAHAVAKLYEPLARHTTLRVGGPARFWVEPTTEATFAAALRFAREHELPVFVIGRGSNLLVRDGGIDGLVIHPDGGDFARLEVDAEHGQITAGAGVKLKQLSGAAAKHGIGGFEWMEGIPGEVGGGLRMNAGAMGAETFDQVVSLRCVTPEGSIVERTPADFEIHYRDVPTLRTLFALSATFRGGASSREEIQRLLDQSANKRKTSQPIAASAGCIFKNPSTEWPAGKLVQDLGLKGAHVGAARVSEVHGNFIVNDGGATAADVLALIEIIRQKAQGERAIRLETEVQVVGED